MSAKQVLIVGSSTVEGSLAHYSDLIGSAESVIAADGGVDICRKAGRVPDMCVGDFDSATPDALGWAESGGAEIVRYPAAKDESDLDLALAAARARGCSSVTFTGAFSGRLDHTLSALGTLVAAADLHASADEPEWFAYPLRAGGRDARVLTEAAGTVISVISLSDDTVVSLRGMKYTLDRVGVRLLSSRGLSNEALDSTQHIGVHSGCAVVFVNRAAR